MEKNITAKITIARITMGRNIMERTIIMGRLRVTKATITPMIIIRGPGTSHFCPPLPQNITDMNKTITMTTNGILPDITSTLMVFLMHLKCISLTLKVYVGTIMEMP
nr:unnamed protein product [Callosobruchus chinensis]